MFYNSARENLLHNFLEKYYKFTVVSCIDCLISDIQMRCPFKTEYDKTTNNLSIWLDFDNILNYKLIFEERQNNKSISHYLKNIE